MAKLAKQIYDIISLATDKGVTTYYSDDQVMQAIDFAQMSFFRELVSEFAKTKKVRNELFPFMKRANIAITNNLGPLPSDYLHEMDLWALVGGVNYEIRIFEAGVFRRRLRDPIDVHSTTNLIANIFNDGTAQQLELSDQVTPVVFNYFIRPVKPIYVTTLTYTFTVTSANATVGATYTNNGQTFTVVNTIAGATTLICTSPGTGPTASGTLTKSSGTGDATITFSAVTSTTQYVYNDALSTDVGWPPQCLDRLAKDACAILGLTFRDMQVQRFGQPQIPIEASTV